MGAAVRRLPTVVHYRHESLGAPAPGSEPLFVGVVHGVRLFVLRLHLVAASGGVVSAEHLDPPCAPGGFEQHCHCGLVRMIVVRVTIYALGSGVLFEFP